MAIRLTHQGVVLGEISDVTAEGLEMLGKFAPYPAADSYQALFQYMVDEDNSLDEDPPFSANLLDDSLWHVVDAGVVKDIFIPGVYQNGVIAWRWR